jgi:D-sedoheptulose 7-phosphate isomerase
MNREQAIALARVEFEESARVLRRVGDEQAEFVVRAAEIVEAALRGGGTLFTCGNGGSAADAQHIAAELSGRFYLERPGLAAVALTVNTSALTAIGNDYAFREVFSRQIDGLGRKGDVLLAISTSGGSANVVEAVKKAREKEMAVVGLTGALGGAFARACDAALLVPSENVARIQEAHICAGHLICQLVENAFFGGEKR